jgi:hypothetical protein
VNNNRRANTRLCVGKSRRGGEGRTGRASGGGDAPTTGEVGRGRGEGEGGA